MTLSYTPRLKLAIPDFLTEPWHSEFEQAMQSIDRAVYNAILVQSASLWLNATAYVVGDVIISPDNGVLYTCAVLHTSASAGTFTADLTANPTYWTTFAPSLATEAEAEGGVENTKYMSALRTSQAIAALTATTSLNNPRCGLLEFVNSTTLVFKPKLGDRIKINGLLEAIPAAGINILNSGLSDNTVYLVFARMNAGVLTGELRNIAVGPITHAPSMAAGNVGTEVMVNAGTPDESRTLIGIVRTSGSSHTFVDSDTQRFVRSWFNAPTKSLLRPFTADSTATTDVFAEMLTGATTYRLEWINFGEEVVSLHFGGPIYNPAASLNVLYLNLVMDGTAQDAAIYHETYADTTTRTVSCGVSIQPGEGYHFAAMYGKVSVTGGAEACLLFVDVNAAGTRPAMSGIIPARG